GRWPRWRFAPWPGEPSLPECQSGLLNVSSIDFLSLPGREEPRRLEPQLLSSAWAAPISENSRKHWAANLLLHLRMPEARYLLQQIFRLLPTCGSRAREWIGLSTKPLQ